MVDKVYIVHFKVHEIYFGLHKSFRVHETYFWVQSFLRCAEKNTKLLLRLLIFLD